MAATLSNQREDRPWGYFEILADRPDHKVKRIVVYPGQRLSLQRHSLRSEHWYVLQGDARVTRDEEVLLVRAHQAVELPRGTWHRLENTGDGELALIEIQTGDGFAEDDIERRDDDYGRS